MEILQKVLSFEAVVTKKRESLYGDGAYLFPHKVYILEKDEAVFSMLTKDNQIIIRN